MSAREGLAALATQAAGALAARHWGRRSARFARWPGPIVDGLDGTGARWAPGDALGLVRARCTDGGLWERDPGAPPLFCLPIIASVFDWPDDVAVFDPAQPERVWFLIGGSTAQHEGEILNGTGPLVLYPDLLAWARARGEGAVIFDLEAWAPVLVELQRPLHCASRALAEAVDRATKAALRRMRPKAPPIGVISPERVAA